MDECFPDGYLYDKGYSWVKVNGNIAEVGIAKPFVMSAKEFLFIELPKKGHIKKGQPYVSLESIKWTGHIESPVEGEIIEVNDALFDEPSLLNREPYKQWIMKVRLDSRAKVKNKHLRGEEKCIKECLKRLIKILEGLQKKPLHR